MTIVFIQIFLSSFSAVAARKTLEERKEREKDLYEECLRNKSFLTSNIQTECKASYHHYYNKAASDAYSHLAAIKNGRIKISEFNMLHPGMGKTRFKDYTVLAKIINKFDIVGATELIPNPSYDKKVNTDIVDFIKNTPTRIQILNEEIKNLKLKNSEAEAIKKSLTLKKAEVEVLSKDIQNVKAIYRFPGYLKILQELQKLKDGENWALILSPRGESATTSPQDELIGYFYRKNIIKPIDNEYCSDTSSMRSKNYACIVNMDSADLGQDKTHVFSRRPFLAEFSSGNFSFVLITSHLLFESPTEKKDMIKIMQSAFTVDSYKDIDAIGIDKANYARFAEAKVTMEFINKNLLKKNLSNVIYMGDFNLEADNKFWPTVMKTWPGAKIFITEKTSTTKPRLIGPQSNRVLTNGLSSSYDHFIFEPKKIPGCMKTETKLNGGVLNFHEGQFGRLIDRKYKIRINDEGILDDDEKYDFDHTQYAKLEETFITPKAKSGANQFYRIARKKIKVNRVNREYTLTMKGIATDVRSNIGYQKRFYDWILESQLSNKTFFDYFKHIISDHLPIYMSCSNQ